MRIKKLLDRFANFLSQNDQSIKHTQPMLRQSHIHDDPAAHIAQLKDEVRLLHHVIDSVPVSIFWKDLQGVYRGINKHGTMTARVNSKDDIIGKSIKELLLVDPSTNTPGSEQTDQMVMHNIEQTDQMIMRTGKSQKIEEQGFSLDPCNNPPTYLSVKEPLYDQSGTINGMVGISIDISELKQTERALQQAKEKAEAANEAKTEFISNMRHDLRTPFNGILGMAEILAHQETDPQKSEYIGYIVQSSKKLLDHLSEILEFTQLEEGRLPLLDKPFDLHQLIIDVSEMMQPSMTAKNLSFDVLISEDVPLSCVGDPSRTQRILMNLLSNAVKFTKQGQVCLSIMAHRDIHDKIIVSFEVKDTGIGIPEDKKDMVFEKFNRITSSYSGVYEGMGLGLHMVKNFLDELEGEVQLQSAPGQGSTFTVLIPFKRSLG